MGISALETAVAAALDSSVGARWSRTSVTLGSQHCNGNAFNEAEVSGIRLGHAEDRVPQHQNVLGAELTRKKKSLPASARGVRRAGDGSHENM